MALVDDPLAGALQAKLKPLLEGGFVYAPYVPMQMQKPDDAVEVVTISEEVLEALPPSDEGGIQVGDGGGPAVLIPKAVEVKPKTPKFNPTGLMARYGQTAINPDFYKSILISTP